MEKKSHAFILFGKSGSGKGTQGALLKAELEKQGRTVIYIETGKLFRDFIASHSGHLADQTRDILDHGKLMPPFFPIYLWANVLVNTYTGTEDIIFDGISRKVEEAPIVSSALDFLDIQSRTIVHIEVSDAWVIEHLLSRAREDDTLPNITKRLSWYTESVIPVLEYFKNHEAYHFLSINGEQSVDAVHAAIMTQITE